MKYKSILFTVSSAIMLIGVQLNAKVVNQNTAQSVANGFLLSKGIEAKELIPVHQDSDPAVMHAPSIDGKAPAYHIFSDREHNAVIVVAGDDMARPILGYSFSPDQDADGNYPPAMKDWLDEMERQIDYARNSGLPDKAIRQQNLPYNSVNVIKQLTTAQWGQSFPFNLYCPSIGMQTCLTGCVATSYAILMKYYGSPYGGNGRTQGYISSKTGVSVAPRDLNHSYQWDRMPLEITQETSSEQFHEIAMLMADIGAAIQADYGTDETSAGYDKQAIFAHFGYNNGLYRQQSDYSAQEWYSMIKSQLDNNRPVLYNAKTSDNSGAHSFIIDGYAQDDYFCINWGWEGQYNGVFALNAMDLDFTDYNGLQSAYFDFQSAAGMPTVAVVNDSINCPSVEAAMGVVSLVNQPARITLVQNSVTDEVFVKNGQNVILDLNGHTLDIEKWGFFNYGTLTVKDTDGNGKINITRGNTAILNNYGNLTVEGGNFTNLMAKSSSTDYRRCIWNDAYGTVRVKDGKFTCNGQVVCNNGKLTIDKGSFQCTDDSDILVNFSRNDTLTVNGGTFQTTVEGNYCRNIWTADKTVTIINGGSFLSNKTVICLNGDATINNGQFRCAGDATTIVNYCKTGTLTINGGTFRNSLKNNGNYHRAVWTDSETYTHITGGVFISYFQTVTVNGDALIDGGSFESYGSAGILSAGNVIINNCKLKADNWILYAAEGFSIKCYGGLYSKTVSNEFLGNGSVCSRNTDSATSSTYPYKVVNTLNGINPVYRQDDIRDINYDLNGIVIPDNNPGIHIIRNSEGKAVKVLVK